TSHHITRPTPTTTLFPYTTLFRSIPNPKIQISNKSQTPNHQNGKWRKTARPGGSNIPFRGIGSRIREAATKDDWQHRGRSAADSRFRLRGGQLVEADEALSKKDFLMRVKICRKEAKESLLFLRLVDTGLTKNNGTDRDARASEARELTLIFS